MEKFISFYSKSRFGRNASSLHSARYTFLRVTPTFLAPCKSTHTTAPITNQNCVFFFFGTNHSPDSLCILALNFSNFEESLEIDDEIQRMGCTRSSRTKSVTRSFTSWNSVWKAAKIIDLGRKVRKKEYCCWEKEERNRAREPEEQGKEIVLHITNLR